MLVSLSIMRPPIWDLPFEIMCDASDYTVGAVLGEREDRKPFVIYYASKTLDSTQRSIYGFKHASRSWNLRFDEFVKEFSFMKLKMSLVYTRRLVGVQLSS